MRNSPPPGSGPEPPDPEGEGALSGADGRSLQRALANLRERVRLQDGEIDELHSLIRAIPTKPMQQSLTMGEPLGPVRDRLDELERKLAEKPAAAAPSVTAPAVTAEGWGSDQQQRLERLESEFGEQKRTLAEVSEVMSRTDENLQRLITEVDRLVTEVARRAEMGSLREDAVIPVADELGYEGPPERFRWKTPIIVLAVLCCLALGGWVLARRMGSGGTTRASGGGSSSPMEQARVFEEQKDYPKAEALYRDVLARDPANSEAVRHLASVLFREDKWEESATVLRKLNEHGEAAASQ